MTGNIVAGKINGGIAEKPPNLTHHYFTCNIIFTKKFVNPPNFTCHIAKFFPIFFPDCVFVCSFKVKQHLKLKDGGEPMTTNGDFGELRQRFDLESP